MSELKLDNFLLIRSPAYSYKNFNEQFLREALAADFFRAAIFLGSRVFFNELKKKDFDYDQLNEQVKLSIWKYFNRMCYRSLPYGLFSSYSTLNWEKEQTTGLVFTGKESLTVRPDFKIVTDYINKLNPQDFPSLKYYTNNSLYSSGKDLRFISQAYLPKQKLTIAELKTSAELNKLLDFIRIGRTKKEIIGFLINLYKEEDLVTSYFDDLLKGQVITSAFAPNVTGTTYGDRCYALIKDHMAVAEHQLASSEIEIWEQDLSLSQLDAVLHTVNIDNCSYTLYQREISGKLNEALKPELLMLAAQMDKLSADQEIDHMKTFKSDFLKKYDQQEIPLMEALDPGVGIGYQNLASAFAPQEEDYIADIRAVEEKQKVMKWGEVEKMIFKKWHHLTPSRQDKIVITEEDLDQLAQPKQALPPGLFVLFKTVDGKIWLDNLAGVSGIEINARFGAEDTEVQTALKAICKYEMEVNNDYIFAEIAFSPNDRASNINQRGHFYPYEIPVLTHSALDDDFIIRLSDLMVSIRENRVYLRSKRLSRFIIPRLSSAYNYQISTVPAFRFLCDLQFQGVKSNLSFSLSGMFPGLDYYPRVEMGTAVISAATWVLNEGQLKNITAGTTDFVKELGLPPFFSLQEGDNYLVFNAGAEADRLMFRKCLKNKKTAILTEYVLGEKELLQNKDGKPFSSQMVACVLNQLKSYPLPGPGLVHHKKRGVKVKRSFLPGEDWLYLKLYTHYSIADELLIDLILPVLKKYKKSYSGFKWFFIRYQDPAQHLRLRFRSSPELSLALLSDLSRILQPWFASGKVTDLLQDSYKRELEKYSSVLINEVESFFYADTEYVLSALNLLQHRNNTFRLSFAVNSSLQLIHSFISDKKEKQDFLHAALDHLSAEFNRSKDMIHKLDSKYRNFQKELVMPNAIAVLEKNSKDYDEQLRVLAAKTSKWPRAERYNLLINLVHMHINRVFEHQPREYEYVSYHFMQKHQAYLNYKTNGVF